VTTSAIAKLTTADELLRMGDVGRCELVRGEIGHPIPVGVRRGRIANAVCSALAQHARERGLGAVCGSRTGIVIERDPDTVRAPDAMFISRERMPPGEEPDGFLPFPPDLAAEVISPDDRWSEIEENVAEYLRAGVPLVWVIDPKTKQVHVHRAGQDVQVLGPEDVLTGEDVLPGFSCLVADLLA